MSLSPAMLVWLDERRTEARAILASVHTTPSQKTVARYFLALWGGG